MGLKCLGRERREMRNEPFIRDRRDPKQNLFKPFNIWAREQQFDLGKAGPTVGKPKFLQLTCPTELP